MNQRDYESQTILIIDDSPEDRAAIRAALMKGAPERRYHFMEAGNGADGLEICLGENDDQIDCVFVDMHMPGIGGVDFLRDLRGSDEYLRLPLIILTGSTNQDDAKAALQNGAQDYIFKDGFHPHMLFRIVDNAIERHSMTKRLHESERAAAQANEAKSALIGNISHELRTPMTAVLGLCDLLLETELTVDQRDLLSMIRANGSYLVEIINDLLDFSKLEASRLEISPGPVDLHQFLGELVSLMRVRANENDTHLHSHFSVDLPRGIMADPIRLRQILINLLSNAIKFTPGGEVTLEVVEANHQGARSLLFHVHDTGPGIPETDLQSIFEPFVQSRSGHIKRSTGTGLGLSICRRLACHMQGDILLDTEVDVGSSFTLVLPLQECSLPEDTESSLREDSEHDSSGIIAGCRVLVADDAPATRFLLTRFLEGAGAIVTLAKDGAQLVKFMQEHGEEFEIVITDVQMPIIDGIEATRRIRGFNDNTPIVVLTADAMGQTEMLAREAGASLVITKPIDRLEFIRALSFYCDRSDTSCDDSTSSTQLS